MKINYKIKLLIIGTLLVLSSCDNTNSKAKTEAANNPAPVIPLSISAPNVIHLSQNPSSQANILKVNNPGVDSYTLAALYVTDLSGKEDQSHLLKISSNQCKTLGSQSSCSMKLKPQGTTPTPVVVELILKNHDGKNQVLHQTVHINEKA